MGSFTDALFEQDVHCSCGHHRGSHNHGFTARACMWCECREFVDGKLPATVPAPALRRAIAFG